MRPSSILPCALIVFLGIGNTVRGQTCVPCEPPVDPNTAFGICGRWVAIPSCPFRQRSACNTGQPQDPVGWPNGVNAVHAVLLHTGKVLLFRETDNWDYAGNGPIRWPVFWDPITFQVTSLDSTTPPESWFCAGQVVAPDGRVVIVGGTDTTDPPSPPNIHPTGLRKTYLVDPTTGQWSYGADMDYRRWYPTATVLPNGKILATDGQQTGTSGGYLAADIPEMHSFAPTSDWVRLDSAQNPNMALYPFVHVIPGPGIRVLHAGPKLPGGGMQVLEGLETSAPYWVASASDQLHGGTVAMYDKGKVLKTGGTAPEALNGTMAEKATEVVSIDLVTGQVSTPTASDDMALERIEHNLVTLPDGKVLVVGGGRKCCDGAMELTDAVYETQIWYPGSSDWCRVAPMTHRQPPNGPIPRMYHSTALLLPDGRVLVAGGQVNDEELKPPCPQDPGLGGIFPECRSADFFEPPYLFRASDHMPIGQILDGRPEVSSLPEFLPYGEPLSFTATVGTGISGATTISKISLIRPSAVTHSNDMDQRFIPLSPFSYDSGAVSVAASNMPGPSLAPPGYYMLFVLNNLGHPSVGQFVNLWGVVESSVTHTVTQQCNGGGGGPSLTFNVSWTTTIQSTGTDTLQIYSPAGTCGSGAGNPTAGPAGSFTHQLSKSVACQNGTWKYIVKSNHGGKTSKSQCRTVQVTCMTCCPPPGCELE